MNKPRPAVSRSLAVTAVAALSVGLGLPALHASAAPVHGHYGVAPQLAAPATAMVQGLVVDQLDRPVDDVKVTAFDEAGDPVASAITYASDRADGPQHGYYYLETGAGDFTVVFKKPGYKPTRVEVSRERRERAAIDPVTLQKMRAETTVRLHAPDKVTTRTRVHVSFGVVPGRPTGKVRLTVDGDTEGAVVLERNDRGDGAFDLGRLSPGQHTVKASYVGDAANLPDSDKETITVKPVGGNGGHGGKGGRGGRG